MLAQSQNRWPSLRHDLLAVNGLASPLFVAGFYYKTLMWPAAFWERLYEPMICWPRGLRAVTGALAGAGAKVKAFVDLQHDATTADIQLSAQEGFAAVEHLKRYPTLGMGTDQGKTSNLLGLALLAQATGKSIAATGTTMFRPPYTPVTIGALAGRMVSTPR